MEDLPTFLKKKGFIYPSSEIYGGLAGFYDYGHLGTLIKRNFENIWRNYFLKLNPNYYEINTAQIMHRDVFKASGHLEHFVDPVINCSKCDFTDRADHFLSANTKEKHLEGLKPEQFDQLIKKHNLQCPKCKSYFQPTQLINMMFPINLGTQKTSQAYLRPETAQSPYVNFKLQYELQRKKLPLGLAIIGKAFRNEISPRNLTLRQREFTQAELQIFFNPKSFPVNFKEIENYKLIILLVKDRKSGKPKKLACKQLKLSSKGEKGLGNSKNSQSKDFPEWYLYHLAKIQKFYLEVLKVPENKFRLFQLSDEEKAFYNKYHFDIEIELNNLGFTEIGGLHYRTDHDLQGHQKISKQSMEIQDENNNKFIPHVLELSFGVDRTLYALLDLSLKDDKKRGNAVMQLPKNLAPITLAIFPLVRKEPKLVKIAQQIYKQLNCCYQCFYDETASVGRRYARVDEIGVPYCITVDFDSLKDKAVTIRDRDTTKQKRVKIKDLNNQIFQLIIK